MVFNAVLDTDDNGDGVSDTGLYMRSQGTLRLVARSSTVISDVGTVDHLNPPGFVGLDEYPHSGAIINDRGQVFFQATLTDGRGVLLVATPKP